jgi:hypothetical protein
MEVKNFMNRNKNLSYENLENILYEKYKLKINIDKNNKYYMICTTNNSNFKNIFVRQSTGIILEKYTNKILHYFGEKAYDIDNNYNNNIINLQDINIKSCYITQYTDGYIIKTFYHKGEWKFATSKHTDIKYFEIKDRNTNLYNIFKDYVLKTFSTMQDFLNLLDEKYCYTFILNNNNINMINKFDLNILKEQFNFNNYNPLNKYFINENEKNEKFIIIEKGNNNEIVKKIHISINSIKRLLYKNICRYNGKCFNNLCDLIHTIKPDIKKNYKEYIVLEKDKNILFKSQSCKNVDCKYHIINKCKYKHNDDPDV